MIGDWRRESEKVIIEVLERARGLPIDEVKKLLFDAYPFGERKYWPYKVWCSAKNEMLIKYGYEEIPSGELPLFAKGNQDEATTKR